MDDLEVVVGRVVDGDEGMPSAPETADRPGGGGEWRARRSRALPGERSLERLLLEREELLGRRAGRLGTELSSSRRRRGRAAMGGGPGGMLAVVEEHDFQIWRALGTCLLDAAKTGLGRFDEDLAQISQGIDQYQGLKSPPVFWALLRFVQAGAYARAGRASPDRRGHQRSPVMAPG